MEGSFRGADHLPNRRPDGHPAPPGRLPRQRKGITPQMHGRYPDYDVLAEAGHWDELTRHAILDRVENVPPIRFFGAEEAGALGAFCDVVLAQDAEPRVPVLSMVDAKFAAGRADGFQHADMPPDPETWRIVARALDETAARRGAGGFATAADDVQRSIVDDFAHARLAGGAWDRVRVELAWTVVMRSVLEAFYSHPWAWNEIGFGGPAYPRGYARMGVGLRESWEGAEALDLDPVADVRERGLS